MFFVLDLVHLQMRFNLRKTFPLLTTKKIFWLGVVEEILQLISGSNNPKVKPRETCATTQ
jgi:thymidylate synthase